jgi:hypothetical protein
MCGITPTTPYQGLRRTTPICTDAVVVRLPLFPCHAKDTPCGWPLPTNRCRNAARRVTLGGPQILLTRRAADSYLYTDG